MSKDVKWFVDEFLYFRGTLHVNGWIFHPTSEIVELGYLVSENRGTSEDHTYHRLADFRLPSEDVARDHSANTARNCRFRLEAKIPAAEVARNVKLMYRLDNGLSDCIENLAQRRLSADCYHQLIERFFKMLKEKQEGAVLEIGSRNRSGVIRRDRIPERMRYIGMDILAGENVDVIGDAHNLTSLFEADTFDGAFAMSVFEHLLMPWKAAIELNRILKPSGLVLITTHQTWPLHEVPWDYWRFSDEAWRALFNKKTGFEILATALGERASIVPHLLHPPTVNLDLQPAYLGSAVLCQKVGASQLRWDVELQDLVGTVYPK